MTETRYLTEPTREKHKGDSFVLLVHVNIPFCKEVAIIGINFYSRFITCLSTWLSRIELFYFLRSLLTGCHGSECGAFLPLSLLLSLPLHGDPMEEVRAPPRWKVSRRIEHTLIRQLLIMAS